MDNIDSFVIEHDQMFRRRLSELIENNDSTSVVDTLGGDYKDDITTKLNKANPDVLLLGIDGINSKEMELFGQLRKELPKLPIVVMPPHNREGANIALTALKNGAVEYINKTRSHNGSLHTRGHFSKWLMPVIKAVPRMNKNILSSDQRIDQAVKKMDRVSSLYFDQSLARMDLLAIVGCLGGIPALYLLLSSLPENLPVPVVVVQHMPKIYTRILAEDLNRYSALTVREAEEGDELRAGQVHIAPGGYHAKVKTEQDKNVISLSEDPQQKDYRPSFDIMLKSIRSVFRNKALTVYLSGGGTDGIEGAKVLDIAGSQIIIQNRRTALLWDLPQKLDILAIDEGSYPLERLGHQISQRLI